MIRGSESMIDNINHFDEWDEPNFDFRPRLNDELCNTEITIESTIREDRTITETRRSIVSNALSTTVSFVRIMIRHINQIHNQLVRSKHAQKLGI